MMNKSNESYVKEQKSVTVIIFKKNQLDDFEIFVSFFCFYMFCC